MNKDLYGNTVQLPEDVVEYLQQCFDSANTEDSTIEGFKRNQELRDSRETTYQQLKRMKNWFEYLKLNFSLANYLKSLASRFYLP